MSLSFWPGKRPPLGGKHCLPGFTEQRSPRLLRPSERKRGGRRSASGSRSSSAARRPLGWRPPGSRPPAPARRSARRSGRHSDGPRGAVGDQRRGLARRQLEGVGALLVHDLDERSSGPRKISVEGTDEPDVQLVDVPGPAAGPEGEEAAVAVHEIERPARPGGSSRVTGPGAPLRRAGSPPAR